MSGFAALTSLFRSHRGSHSFRRCDVDRTSSRILSGPFFFCVLFCTPRVAKMVLGMTNGPLHFRPGLGVRSGAMAPKYSLVRCAALVNSLPPRSHRAYTEGPRSRLSEIVPHRTTSHQPCREGPRSPPSHIQRVQKTRMSIPSFPEDHRFPTPHGAALTAAGKRAPLTEGPPEHGVPRGLTAPSGSRWPCWPSLCAGWCQTSGRATP